MTVLEQRFLELVPKLLGDILKKQEVIFNTLVDIENLLEKIKDNES